jgi:hypothetical protein
MPEPEELPAYPAFPMTVGDLASNERGSGARANGGKPDYSLVPIKMMAETLKERHGNSSPVQALFLVGCYQSTHNIAWLYKAIEELGFEGWAECARAFEYGKKKYAAWNWAKGMPWSVPLACVVRHLIDMIEGRELDDESVLPHRGHVLCNIVMLVTYSRTYPEGNDLPPIGRLA